MTGRTKRKALRALLMGLAVCCILYGISRQEPFVVLQKAVKICLECIGIG